MKALIGKRHLETVRPPQGKAYIFIQDTGQPALFARIHEGGVVSWVLRYTFKGKRRRLRIGGWPTWTPQEARRRAKLLLAGAEMGIDPAEEARGRETSGAVTWGALVERYLDHCRTRPKPLKPATWEQYRQTLHDYTMEAWGGRPLADIARRDVVSLHGEIGKTRPRVANRTVAIIRAAFNFAMDQEIIASNPALRVPLFAERRRERVLVGDERERLLAAIAELEAIGEVAAVERAGESHGRGGQGMKEIAPRGISPHAAALFRLLLATGARLREIMHCRWGWVHAQDDPPHIAIPPAEHKGGAQTGKPRVIYLLPEAVEEIRKLEGIRTSEWLIEGRAPGRPLDSPRKAWGRVCAAAGIEGLTPHGLRHSWVSSLVNAGVSPALIQRGAGHQQLSTTIDRYFTDDRRAVYSELVRATRGAHIVEISKAKAEGGEGSS